MALPAVAHSSEADLPTSRLNAKCKRQHVSAFAAASGLFAVGGARGSLYHINKNDMCMNMLHTSPPLQAPISKARGYIAVTCPQLACGKKCELCPGFANGELHARQPCCFLPVFQQHMLGKACPTLCKKVPVLIFVHVFYTGWAAPLNPAPSHCS